MLTHRDGYRFHHLAVVDDVRPRRVDGHVVAVLCSPCRYLGHVFARDRLQTEITLAGDSEPRKSPQEPRDVVDQDVACAKDESWPDDRPGKTRLAHHLLGVGLAGVILEMESSDGLLTEMWTTLRTPASRAAPSRIRVFATASPKRTLP